MIQTLLLMGLHAASLLNHHQGDSRSLHLSDRRWNEFGNRRLGIAISKHVGGQRHVKRCVL
jgi:hypothetical protein